MMCAAPDTCSLLIWSHDELKVGKMLLLNLLGWEAAVVFPLLLLAMENSPVWPCCWRWCAVRQLSLVDTVLQPCSVCASSAEHTHGIPGYTLSDLYRYIHIKKLGIRCVCFKNIVISNDKLILEWGCWKSSVIRLF